MKKLSGFSLMEMMIVLLIVSIVAAASAPMINKKLVGVATDKSPWVWVGNENSIAYNLLGANTQTATIGATQSSDAKKPRLFIKNAANAKDIPHIALQNGDAESLKIGYADKLISINTKEFPIPARGATSNHSVIMGSNITLTSGYSRRNVVIGTDANCPARDSVVIGHNSTGAISSTVVGVNVVASGNNSVAIGTSSNSSLYAVALGNSANARGDSSIAIGYNSNVTAPSSITIGQGSTIADATARNSIVIGSLATSAGANSISMGRGVRSRSNSVVIGNSANGGGLDTIAIGNIAYAASYRAMAIGDNARALNEKTVAIGHNSCGHSFNATSVGERSIAGYGATAIGSEANAASSHSVALGYQARTGNSLSTGPSYDSGAIAIGPRANAKGQDAIAIGTNTLANFDNSVAIGIHAEAKASNQIVLGTANHTVYIPGKLVVANDVFLATTAGRKVYARVPENTGSNDWLQILRHWDGGGWALKAHSSPANYNVPGLGSIKSDRRLKTVGKAFIGGLNEIKKLEVFNYTFKSDKSKTPRVGVMAQDLQKIFPNAVVKGDDGFLRIRMEDMFYALINAVKENDRRITVLEKENMELKKRLADLEKKIK